MCLHSEKISIHLRINWDHDLFLVSEVVSSISGWCNTTNVTLKLQKRRLDRVPTALRLSEPIATILGNTPICARCTAACFRSAPEAALCCALQRIRASSIFAAFRCTEPMESGRNGTENAVNYQNKDRKTRSEHVNKVRQEWRSASEALPVRYEAVWGMERNSVRHEALQSGPRWNQGVTPYEALCWGPPAPHVLDVSLLRTVDWSSSLITQHSFESGVSEQRNI